ncbi:hypothetical protein L226DRAFT_288956 [Lentinus tigrinus ALCF2SS1-7]|uniref:uncharacterized protein n=1 Tax=Lentinus tigrinus ALCF2SS1-7 TaxID=1328758 RepID=UPI0011661DB5|nr:hypothetical protein L226DRAFT_288956 [Lentinus tigrinus ALCF2SS1-7]
MRVLRNFVQGMCVDLQVQVQTLVVSLFLSISPQDGILDTIRACVPIGTPPSPPAAKQAPAPSSPILRVTRFQAGKASQSASTEPAAQLRKVQTRPAMTRAPGLLSGAAWTYRASGFPDTRYKLARSDGGAGSDSEGAIWGARRRADARAFELEFKT